MYVTLFGIVTKPDRLLQLWNEFDPMYFNAVLKVKDVMAVC